MFYLIIKFCIFYCCTLNFMQRSTLSAGSIINWFASGFLFAAINLFGGRHAPSRICYLLFNEWMGKFPWGRCLCGESFKSWVELSWAEQSLVFLYLCLLLLCLLCFFFFVFCHRAACKFALFMLIHPHTVTQTENWLLWLDCCCAAVGMQ